MDGKSTPPVDIGQPPFDLRRCEALPHNQPMLDIRKPDTYDSFAAWLQAVCQPRGKQREIALATGSKPQAVTKWMKGGSVKTEKLQALAVATGVEYIALRMLLDKVKAPAPAPGAKPHWPLPKTELGCNVGRKWEELIEPAKSQILNVLETLLTLQRDSYRQYTANQRNIAANRPKKKLREEI